MTLLNEFAIGLSTKEVATIVSGKQTQLRRVVIINETTEGLWYPIKSKHSTLYKDIDQLRAALYSRVTPFGFVGSYLWGTEDYRTHSSHGAPLAKVSYRADLPEDEQSKFEWKSKITMRKEHCRIWLRTTNIRVEPLHEATEEDAEREGYDKFSEGVGARVNLKLDWSSPFRRTAPYWKDNPLTWIISFERCARPSSSE